jgi:para-nitrobenzyl esterase
MAALMSPAWIAFARTGNPSHPGLPAWPRYETGRRATMIFDTQPRVVNDPESEVRKVLQS